MMIAAERDDLVLCLSHYRTFKKNLERNILVKDVISKVMKESVRQLKEELSSLENEN